MKSILRLFFILFINPIILNSIFPDFQLQKDLIKEYLAKENANPKRGQMKLQSQQRQLITQL